MILSSIFALLAILGAHGQIVVPIIAQETTTILSANLEPTFNNSNTLEVLETPKQAAVINSLSTTGLPTVNIMPTRDLSSFPIIIPTSTTATATILSSRFSTQDSLSIIPTSTWATSASVSIVSGTTAQPSSSLEVTTKSYPFSSVSRIVSSTLSSTSSNRPSSTPSIDPNYEYVTLPQGPFTGKTNQGIGSWFRTNAATDSTNGNSWCNYPYNDGMIGFAPPLRGMTGGQDAWYGFNTDLWRRTGRAYCGLEAVIYNPENGKSINAVILDAFSAEWVRTPESIDITLTAFARLTDG